MNSKPCERLAPNTKYNFIALEDSSSKEWASSSLDNLFSYNSVIEWDITCQMELEVSLCHEIIPNFFGIIMNFQWLVKSANSYQSSMEGKTRYYNSNI